MGKITFVHPDDVPLVDRSRSTDEPAWISAIIPRTNRTRWQLPGTESTPQLFEPGFAPGTGAAPHAHGEDEVLYVLEGTLQFGRRVFPRGSTIFIPAYTLYSFEAGEEGCRFLNFRPRKDDTLLTAEDLAARRRSG